MEARTAYAVSIGSYSDYRVLVIYEAERDARAAHADPVLWGLLDVGTSIETWEIADPDDEDDSLVWQCENWGLEAAVEEFDYYPAEGSPLGLPVRKEEAWD